MEESERKQKMCFMNKKEVAGGNQMISTSKY